MGWTNPEAEGSSVALSSPPNGSLQGGGLNAQEGKHEDCGARSEHKTSKIGVDIQFIWRASSALLCESATWLLAAYCCFFCSLGDKSPRTSDATSVPSSEQPIVYG